MMTNKVVRPTGIGSLLAALVFGTSSSQTAMAVQLQGGDTVDICGYSINGAENLFRIH